jgi:hypothetical protein
MVTELQAYTDLFNLLAMIFSGSFLIGFILSILKSTQ